MLLNILCVRLKVLCSKQLTSKPPAVDLNFLPCCNRCMGRPLKQAVFLLHLIFHTKITPKALPFIVPHSNPVLILLQEHNCLYSLMSYKSLSSLQWIVQDYPQNVLAQIADTYLSYSVFKTVDSWMCFSMFRSCGPLIPRQMSFQQPS